MGWFIFLVACAIFAAVIAESKGRSAAAWLFLGFLFGPVALLAVGLMPSLGKRPERSERPDDLRKCPQCAELILREAQKCKHCGSAVEPMLPPARPPVARPPTIREDMVRLHAFFRASPVQAWSITGVVIFVFLTLAAVAALTGAFDGAPAPLHP